MQKTQSNTLLFGGTEAGLTNVQLQGQLSANETTVQKSMLCCGVVVVVFSTLTDRASTIYPVIHVVANPVCGLLDRKRSEEHLQSSEHYRLYDGSDCHGQIGISNECILPTLFPITSNRIHTVRGNCDQPDFYHIFNSNVSQTACHTECDQQQACMYVYVWSNI